MGRWTSGCARRRYLIETWGRGMLKIACLMQEAPHTSIPELAKYLDRSESAIERVIRKLRKERRLQRIGPAKGGYWQVLH